MKTFGLTGNIGCGKSTVASFLSKYPDVVIIDCDQIAKKVISSGLHKEEINSILGANVFMGENADFKAIANIIFSDSKKKKLLEELLHPFVWDAVEKKVIANGDQKICIVESAIIYETRNEGKFTAVIVATCNPEEQLRRTLENRNMDNVQIQARIAQQLPSREKERRAQFVIHTDCSLKQLKNRARNLYCNLKQQKGRKE